jgi:hypothetical protein
MPKIKKNIYKGFKILQIFYICILQIFYKLSIVEICVNGQLSVQMSH